MLQKLINDEGKLSINTVSEKELILSTPLFFKKLNLKIKPHYIKKEQSAGEIEIQVLARKKGFKEAEWYFIPDHGLWLSTTTGQSIHYNKNTQEAFLSLQGEIPKFSEFTRSDVIHYHIHPVIIYNQLSKEIGVSKAKLITSLPTKKDLQSYNGLAVRFPENKFTFKIITAHRITTINIINPLTNQQITEISKYLNEKAKETTVLKNDNETINSFLWDFNLKFKNIINIQIEKLK